MNSPQRSILLNIFILTLILIGIPVSANQYTVNSFHLGQIIHYTAVLFALYQANKTNHNKKFCLTCIIGLALKVICLRFNLPYIPFIADICTNIIFLTIGRDLFLSRKNATFPLFVVVFLTVNVVLCILQKIGVHPIFYALSTELFHYNDLYSFDLQQDLGKFIKNIPLNDTLFVPHNQLIVGMYQSRPTGLSYSNNVLSFVLILLLLCFLQNEPKAKNKMILFLCACLHILLSSLYLYMMYFVIILLYGFVQIKSGNIKVYSKYLIICLLLHYIFFPGCTTNSFTSQSILFKLGTRFSSFVELMGFDGYKLFTDLTTYNFFHDPLIDQDSYGFVILENKSMFELNLNMLIVLFALIPLVLGIRKQKAKATNFNYLYFIILVISQITIVYLQTPIAFLFFGYHYKLNTSLS